MSALSVRRATQPRSAGRRSAEAELRAQLAELRADFDSLEYSISHDLRAPLRAIEGFSQAIQEDFGGVLDEQGQDYLGRIRKASLKLSGMVEGLLRLSRAGRRPLERQVIDLSTLCEQLLDHLAKRHHDARVEVAVTPGLTAFGDPELVREALAELLDNAWKSTAGSGSPRIEFCSSMQEGREVFSIRDNGPGFTADSAGRLFVPFQKLHAGDDDGGLGIGLVLAKRIVERHQGRLWAVSSAGGGASFYFTLGDA